MPHDSNKFLERDQRPSIIPVTHLTYPYLQSYYDLGLSDELLKAILDELHIGERPHRMYALTLPMVTSEIHRSLMAQARNVTWKAFVYTVCLMHRIIVNTHDNPQAIVICPQELVNEIHDLIKRFGNFTSVSANFVIDPDVEVDLHTHILISTPAALMTLMWRRKLLLSHVKVVVIDKADQLLEHPTGNTFTIDFMREIHPECQVLLFYATLTDKLRQFVPNILPDWKWDRVFVNKEELAIYNSKTFKLVFEHEYQKSGACFAVIDRLSVDKQVIIYVDPETDVKNLCESLSSIDVKCAPEVKSHHNFDQDPFQSVESFKAGKTRVLIASKPHSVGFDKSMVSMVIFYDLPMKNASEPDFELYYNLATRVGRNIGKVCIFNILNQSDVTMMKKIETYFGRTAKKMSRVDKFDTTVEIEAALDEVGMMKPRAVDLMEEEGEEEGEEEEEEEEEEESEEDADGWGMEDDVLMDDNNDPLAHAQDDHDDHNNWW